MKMKVGRYEIDIIPENETDAAYIMDTLGLKNHGDFIKLVRQCPMGLPGEISYLRAAKEKEG